MKWLRAMVIASDYGDDDERVTSRERRARAAAAYELRRDADAARER